MHMHDFRFDCVSVCRHVGNVSWITHSGYASQLRWFTVLRVTGYVRFPLPELTARVDGCQKMDPSSRAVNSARELGP